MIVLLDPVREGADNFLGESGGVASWSAGAEVSVKCVCERERDEVSCMLTNDYHCSPEPKELAVGEGEMVVNGLLSGKRRQHSITATA